MGLKEDHATPHPSRRMRAGPCSAAVPVSHHGFVPQDDARLPIKMLHDRLLVSLRSDSGDRRSSGGILIPATAQVAKRLVWGEARGVGANVRQVKVGDQVLFSPEDQHEVEVHGEDLVILRERDVHAVAAERIEESTGLYL